MGKFAAGILIECDGLFLICRITPNSHNPKKCDGRWGYPKGKREGDEIPIETAIRETHEETGINLDEYKGDLKLFKEYENNGRKFYVYHVKVNKII